MVSYLTHEKKAYITLISKVASPTRVNDYRSINLCNTIYKFVAKLLMHQLKPILPTVILEKQGAFGRKGIFMKTFCWLKKSCIL